MSETVACPQCGAVQLRTEEGLCASCLLAAGLADAGISQMGMENSREATSVVDVADSQKEVQRSSDLTALTAISADDTAKSTRERTQAFAGTPASDDSLADDTSEFRTGDISLDFLTPSDKPDCLGTLGVYEIVEVIGRGGFGIVLKGIDPNLSRVVAIKVLAPDLASDPTARRRFLREARSAAAVEHVSVVEIHEVNDKALLPYLVMEFVDGSTLDKRIKEQGPLPLEEILRIAAQTAAGLAAAHHQRLIHRDIKPGNILLPKNEDRIKITDFGLARTAEDAHLTRTGTLAGTPQYMSPEQADGADLDTRTDLFSLGSVLYFMCTGEPPFGGDNTVAVLRAVCEEAPAPITRRNRRLPKWLAEIVAKLMAKNPDDRFQTADEVAELLRRHLAHLQNPKKTSRPQRVGPTRNVKHGRQRWLAAAAVLFVLLGGFVLTEATGVTNVTGFGSVFRIHTPDGTLVVKVNDPNIQIEVTRNGDVVIRGAGAQELRLKPGKYKVTASNGGVSKTEWITIERDGRRIVEVHLEPAVAVNGPVVQQKPGASPPAPVTGKDGWVKLFNGRDLAGWTRKIQVRKFLIKELPSPTIETGDLKKRSGDPPRDQNARDDQRQAGGRILEGGAPEVIAAARPAAKTVAAYRREAYTQVHE